MRDSLFRGQRADNGEWVYWNCLGVLTELNFIGESLIGYNYIIALIERQLIDLNTIGQYTGFDDENEIKIFQGDIAKSGFFTFEVVWDKYNAQFKLKVVKYNCKISDEISNEIGEEIHMNEYHAKQIEIIGNIHDNLEAKNEK